MRGMFPVYTAPKNIAIVLVEKSGYNASFVSIGLTKSAAIPLIRNSFVIFVVKTLKNQYLCTFYSKNIEIIVGPLLYQFFQTSIFDVLAQIKIMETWRARQGH